VPYPATPRNEQVHLELAGGVVLDLRVPATPPPEPRTLILGLRVLGSDQSSTIFGRDLHMTRLNDDQEVLLTVAELDSRGDPVPEAKRGQLSAVSSDEGVVTVAPTGTYGEFLVSAVTGANGVSASVLVGDNVDEDADNEFQGSADFDVVDHTVGEVAGLTVSVGAPTTKAGGGGGSPGGGGTPPGGTGGGSEGGAAPDLPQPPG